MDRDLHRAHDDQLRCGNDGINEDGEPGDVLDPGQRGGQPARGGCERRRLCGSVAQGPDQVSLLVSRGPGADVLTSHHTQQRHRVADVDSLLDGDERRIRSVPAQRLDEDLHASPTGEPHLPAQLVADPVAQDSRRRLTCEGGLGLLDDRGLQTATAHGPRHPPVAADEEPGSR